MVSILTVIVPAIVGGIVWLVRLEGKVALGDQHTRYLEQLINSRFDSSDQRMARIEKALNGAFIKAMHDDQR